MILLAHAEEERALYYGDEALAGLRALDEVRLNTSGRPLEGDAFVAAASGCAIIVGDIKSLADARIFAAASESRCLCPRPCRHRSRGRRGRLGERHPGDTCEPRLRPAVAELVIGFMIDLTRGITRSTLMWRAGGSPRTAISSQLSSRILGIIGYGNIGRHLAMLARAMGMRVLVNDPYVQVDPESGGGAGLVR